MFAAMRRVGLGFVVAAVAAALVTTGCAAGQQASTAEEKPTIDGANGNIGPISLLGLHLVAPSTGTVSYPKGSDVAVKLVIVNNGRSADTLTSITSQAFSDWGAYATTDEADRVVAASSSSATSLPEPSRSVQIAPGTRKSWGTPEAKGALLLMGSTKTLHPGTTIQMTFGFKNAGSVTLAVPVALSEAPNISPIPELSPSTSFEG